MVIPAVNVMFLAKEKRRKTVLALVLRSEYEQHLSVATYINFYYDTVLAARKRNEPTKVTSIGT